MPPFDPIEALLERIRGRGGRRPGAWPPESERKTWSDVLDWRAFLDSDRERLAKLAEWDQDGTGRPYRVDPLAERIADAWAEHLFSEDLTVAPATDGDGDLLEELVEAVELTESCRAAERDYVAAEGEGWWRWNVDEEVSEYPLLEWHSRASVAPFYVGSRLVACALISELEGKPNIQAGRNAVFRLFECHAEAEVRNVVFRGTKDKLGAEVDLDAHPETEELEEEWEHGLPMLMGRIVNKRGRNPRLGLSEFHSIRDFLLELNEAVAVGWENMRLTAKKRAVISESTLSASAGPARPTGDDLVDVGDGSLIPRAGRPSFAAGEDLLIADSLNEELGKDGTAGLFKVLEYSFDADALIAHKRDVVETALTRLGITPQWVGIVSDEGAGLALSGTALRLRLIPTTKAGHGKGKAWDKALPRILAAGAQLSALGLEEGGLALDWTDPAALPGVKRAEPLPADEVEDAQIESTLVGAGVRSLRTSIKAQHPEWDDEAVEEERAAIIQDAKDRGGGMGLLA